MSRSQGEGSPADRLLRRQRRGRLRDWVMVAVALALAVIIGLLRRNGVF
ncbi:MAG: hypothetical protein ABW360_01240 [Phenylobacterium sp.]